MPMTAEIELLKDYFAAINRNDLHAISQYFDPEIVRIDPEGFPTAGTYRGIAQVHANVSKGRGTWAEGSCTPEQYLAKSDRVVVYLFAWVRLHDTTEWIGGRFADRFAFRNGKIIDYHSFGERDDALKRAGIEA